jgi:hypothetical protein
LKLQRGLDRFDGASEIFEPTLQTTHDVLYVAAGEVPGACTQREVRVENDPEHQVSQEPLDPCLFAKE